MIEWWLLLKAVIMGIVEGLTEFLPISSTGHLIVIGELLNFTGERAKTFEIFIQLGAILGVMWHYRAKIAHLTARLHTPKTRRFALNVSIAFLPAAVVGLAAHRYIKDYLFDPRTVAVALIVGGFVILWIERMSFKVRAQAVEDISTAQAFKVGLAQMCALFPGVSRAGATIMGGLVAGLSRTTATEFSFFLAMPTMLAATLYDLYANRNALMPGDAMLFGVGFLTAFVAAVVVVRLFLQYVARHNFTFFAYYRIVFGTLVLLYFF